MKGLFIHFLTASLFFTLPLFMPFVDVNAAEGDFADSNEVGKPTTTQEESEQTDFKFEPPLQPNDTAKPNSAADENDQRTTENDVAKPAPMERDNQKAIEFKFEKAAPMTIMGAEDTTNFFFDPRIVAGMLYQKYEEIYEGDSEDVKWKDNIPFVGLGMTFGYKSFSVDVYAQQSASGKDSSFNNKEIINKEVIMGYLTDDYNTDMSREDYAINLSYSRNLFVNLDDRIIFSVGYKAGKTSISGPRRDIVSIQDSGTQNVNRSHEETQFETKGPTVGISYGFPIRESVIGINIAYAWLKTDFSSPERMNVDTGATNGLTLGVFWTRPITNNLTFNFSVDAYNYTMDPVSAKELFIDDSGIPRETEIKLDSIEESVVSVKVSLGYVFDF